MEVIATELGAKEEQSQSAHVNGNGEGPLLNLN